MDLTEKQKLFIHYYLGVSAGNAADAARRAGYAWPDKQGPQQLAKTRVRAAVNARMDEVALTSAEILARLSTLARANADDFLTIDGDTLKVDLKQAKRRGKLPVLRKFKKTGDRVEIELHSPIPALDKLAQYRGLLKDPQSPRKVVEFHILGGNDDDRGGDESGRPPGDGTPGEVLEEPGPA